MSRSDVKLVKWSAIALLLALWWVAGDAPGQTQHVKLQGVLAGLADKVKFTSVTEFAQTRGVALYNGHVEVVIEATSPSAAGRLASEFAALEVRGQAVYHTWIQASVPLEALARLADLPQVAYVRLPFTPQPAAVVSEGVNLIGASQYAQAGLQGAGVKIAIIDLGFEGLTEALANGDLPGDYQAFDFTNSGMGGIAHGTAVAEIVFDVAPKAHLLLMKVANEVQLGQAVEEAIRQGVRVINHSVVWFNTEFGDGSGGVSQIATQAVNRGVLWVNAAGNTALQHWKGPFRDRDDDSWVEFDALGSETLSLEADAGQPIEVFLNWDAWPRTDFDYDLFLTYDANNNGVFDQGETFISSVDPQRGLDPPIEHVRLFAPFTGQYLISIWYKGAAAPPPLEVFTSQHTLRTPVREGSVLAPATAANVLAVGAINASQWSTGALQPFSSRGPTNDGRIKPDLAAPDDVLNFTASRFPFQFGGTGRFLGTSASAPHVAGAAALLMEENLGATVTQTMLALTRNALPLPPSAPNNLSGFGKVHLFLAPSEALPLEVSAPMLASPVVERGQTVSIGVQVSNPHARRVGKTVSLTINGRTVAVQEVLVEPNQTKTVLFNWRFESLGSFTVAVGDGPATTVRVVAPLHVQGIRFAPDGPHTFSLVVQGQGVERVTLSLFDLSGSRVLMLDANTSTLTVPLFNAQGAPLANGIYLYAVTVYGATTVQPFPLKKVLVLF